MPRGLSTDEKKKRLLEWMQEHKEVYTLKELEGPAAKAKGIVSQTVKDVLSQLVSDGLVDTDKIGAGNFFWALPSKAKVMANTRIEKAEAELAAAEARHAELEAALAEAQASRPKSAKRTHELAHLATLKAQAAALEVEVGKFSDSDPDRLKQLEKGVLVCKTAANRWTDNLQSLIGAMREMKSDMSEETIIEHFNLPKGMDYIE